MELRLLLAFILMGVVLFVTPYFYKTVAPPVKKAPPAAATTQPATPATATPAVAAPVDTAPPAGHTAVPPVAGQKEETRIVDTDLFRITFSNRGGVVKSWLLKKHKAHSGESLEMVNKAAHTDLPAALYFPAQKPARRCMRCTPMTTAWPLPSTIPTAPWWPTNPFSSGNPATCWMSPPK
jgi:YidC/Oxa1 family membrane protein insertase